MLQNQNTSMDCLHAWRVKRYIRIRRIFKSNHYESENKDIGFLSYTVKTKCSGKKNTFLLSTMRPLDGVTRDDTTRQNQTFTISNTLPNTLRYHKGHK